MQREPNLPWMNADSLLESGKHLGYQYHVVANRTLGHRCAYVRIPWWHHYAHDHTINLEAYIQCHGGVTFQKRLGDEVWIGFDCGHYGDGQDQTIMNEGAYKRLIIPGGVVRSTEFCVQECKRICEQLQEAWELSVTQSSEASGS